jgi:putative aldouronate transport system permease protein
LVQSKSADRRLRGRQAGGDSGAALPLRSLPKPLIERIGIFLYRYRFYHLLVLPGLLYFLVFRYLPLFGLVIAFKDYRGMGGVLGIFQSRWVAFLNFTNLFTSHYFWRLMRNTLIISSYRLIVEFPAPILLALLLNEVRFRRFKRVVQTITYLPHFVSWVVIAGLMAMLLSTQNGPVNALIARLGGKPVFFLADTSWFRTILVLSSTWKGVGWSSIVYLAAIASIPLEEYEAAEIEGASRLQKAWFITLPSIAFIIAIFLILRVGSIIEENFDQIFNLYNPAVYEVADVFETYVYRRGIIQSDFSYATAVGLFKSVVSLGLVVAANRGARALGQESLW